MSRGERELERTAEHRADGAYIGQFARQYPAGTPMSEIRGVRPTEGEAVLDTRVFYVNGVYNEVADQYAAMQDIADRFRVEVVGIHNMTFGRGSLQDVVRSATEKAGAVTPAVGTIMDLIEQSVHGGTPLNLIGHSEGALQISDGLRHAIVDLRREAASTRDPALRERLHEELSAIHVVTTGDAAVTYPRGPRYEHLQNVGDLVVAVFGHGHLAPFADLHAALDLVTGEATTQFWQVHGFDVRANHLFRDVYVSRIDPSFFQPQRPEPDRADEVPFATERLDTGRREVKEPGDNAGRRADEDDDGVEDEDDALAPEYVDADGEQDNEDGAGYDDGAGYEDGEDSAGDQNREADRRDEYDEADRRDEYDEPDHTDEYDEEGAGSEEDEDEDAWLAGVSPGAGAAGGEDDDGRLDANWDDQGTVAEDERDPPWLAEGPQHALEEIGDQDQRDDDLVADD